MSDFKPHRDNPPPPPKAPPRIERPPLKEPARAPAKQDSSQNRSNRPPAGRPPGAGPSPQTADRGPQNTPASERTINRATPAPDRRTNQDNDRGLVAPRGGTDGHEAIPSGGHVEGTPHARPDERENPTGRTGHIEATPFVEMNSGIQVGDGTTLRDSDIDGHAGVRFSEGTRSQDNSQQQNPIDSAIARFRQGQTGGPGNLLSGNAYTCRLGAASLRSRSCVHASGCGWKA